jgi:hypothetical protein
MIDLSIEVFRGEPGRLAQLLDPQWRDKPNWADEEMESILRHQLSVPVSADLPGYSARNLTTQRHANCQTTAFSFGDLLCDQQPSLELLVGTKDFAMRHLRLGGRGLPRRVARVLYYASVLAALLHWGERISRLSDAKLLSGLDWAIEQPWLDTSLRDLFRKGRVKLATA